jgi:hypothetical protein
MAVIFVCGIEDGTQGIARARPALTTKLHPNPKTKMLCIFKHDFLN